MKTKEQQKISILIKECRKQFRKNLKNDGKNYSEGAPAILEQNYIDGILRKFEVIDAQESNKIKANICLTNLSKEQLSYVLEAERYLCKAGIQFDTGMMMEEPFNRDWDISESAEGIEVYLNEVD